MDEGGISDSQEAQQAQEGTATDSEATDSTFLPTSLQEHQNLAQFRDGETEIQNVGSLKVWNLDFLQNPLSKLWNTPCQLDLSTDSKVFWNIFKSYVSLAEQ